MVDTCKREAESFSRVLTIQDSFVGEFKVSMLFSCGSVFFCCFERLKSAHIAPLCNYGSSGSRFPLFCIPCFYHSVHSPLFVLLIIVLRYL